MWILCKDSRDKRFYQGLLLNVTSGRRHLMLVWNGRVCIIGRRTCETDRTEIGSNADDLKCEAAVRLSGNIQQGF